jgi:hypothetical protein
MVEILRDIEVLENLLIAMDEGASDEKRMALAAVERLVAEKKKVIADFETEFAPKEVELWKEVA